jgi:hypothetical protein
MSNRTLIEEAEESQVPAPDRDSHTAPEAGVHTVVAEIAVGAALWFIRHDMAQLRARRRDRLSAGDRHAVLRDVLHAVPF